MMVTRGKPVETLAYVAGVVDSDGCIGICRKKRTNGYGIVYSARLSVTNTDQPLVDWLKSEFGGFISIRKKAQEHHKTTYTWIISEQKMAVVLRQLLPYLRIKGRQAALLIELKEGMENLANRQGPWREQRVHSEEMDRREAIYEQIKVLNDDRRPHRLTGVASSTDEVIVSTASKDAEAEGTETVRPPIE